jgi:ribonuclease HII
LHRIAPDHPGFSFDVNVGYSTPEHRAAIVELGPSRLHRRSFASIAYSQLSLEATEAALRTEAQI